MTTPSHGTPSVTNNSVSPAAKPPMTDTEVRLECLKQAVILVPPPGTIIDMAARMYAFVTAPKSS